MAELRCDGRVAIVTGAGRGIGRSHALELGRRGAAVLVNDVGATPDGDALRYRADAVVEEIVGAGGTAVASHDSVATPEGGAAIVERALDEFGALEIVVNNAGILRDGPVDELTADEWGAALETHLSGAFYVSQPAFRVMRDRGYGRLVFTSSNVGLYGNPWQANYAAAKGGIVGLSRTIAIEGAGDGIIANAICPLAATAMGDDLKMPPDAFREMGDFMAPLYSRIDPELVTPMVIYLASDACACTGGIFAAQAGRFARVFIGTPPGWLCDNDKTPTAEDVADHWSEIERFAGIECPTSMIDDYRILARLVSELRATSERPRGGYPAEQ